MVDLYQKGILKDRLLKLIGNKNFQIFKKNMTVQGPITIINNEYTFLIGGLPHNAFSDRACLYIDFVNDKISVGLLINGKSILYFTEKKDKHVLHTSGDINGWFMEAYKDIGGNMMKANQ